ncbi:MAG: hypothetical protein HYV97_00360 [Bdellovibrio sp.]|nr:hypothetical protein [Bdellovibrio sp.]
MNGAIILVLLLLFGRSVFASHRVWLEHVIESQHPYDNSSRQVWKVNSLYANKITFVFERLVLAKGDSLILENNTGEVLAQYNGPVDLSNFETSELNSGAIKMLLFSDAHNNQWGFKLKGFFYTREQLSSPKVVYHHHLMMQNRALLKGFTFFQDETLHVMERIYQDNGLPISGKITSVKFSDAGVEILPNIYTGHVADGPLAMIEGTIVGGFEGRIAQLPRGYSFEMYRPYANVSQLFYQDNTVVALAGTRIHAIDIKGENGWQYTMERDALLAITLDDSDRIAFKDQRLVVNQGWTSKKIEIYNLDDPYNLFYVATIRINLAEQERLVFSGWVPTIGNGHVYLPNGHGISVYSLQTGNEVGFLTLPERVGVTANSFFVDKDVLYVPGHFKVYRVDISDPADPKRIDEIEVTRDLRSQGIFSLWVENKKLYVLRKNQDFERNGENGFILTLVSLP